MPLDYTAFIHFEAFEVLQSEAADSASKLMWWIRTLRASPFRKGDYEEKQADGRVFEITVISGHAIYFWVDHAAREVKIMRIRPADRALTP